MRARQPDHAGYAVNDGVRLYYEVAGHGDPSLLFVQPYQIVHSRMWKMQVPFLARHFRTIVYDPRGNGRSDRPVTDYGIESLVGDALAVLDQVGVERCGLVTVSMGASTSLRLAARHPERILGMVLIGGSIAEGAGVTPALEARLRLIRTDYERYVREFWDSVFPEPHSTRPKEEGSTWAHETGPDVLTAAYLHGWIHVDTRPDAALVRCPVLIIHGTEDQRIPYGLGRAMHERLPTSRMVTLAGSGHLPNLRDPVSVNLLVREFFSRWNGLDRTMDPAPRHNVWERALTRPQRVLFVSSSIGLGHIQRDLAIARELRALVPGLQVDWWAQPPVTHALETAGERLHPRAPTQAHESAHWEEESHGGDLHAFYAWRRLDEIFCYNFMLFHDATRATPYDLWIGDESWEVDYYLHENPEVKCAPYVYLTDVIGFLPVDPERDPREAELTADYNAEMIEQRARFPSVRDLSLYIGDCDELPDASFGPGLPSIREWTRQWFETVPYILPFDPDAYRDREALRARLGYGGGSPLLMAAVGGTAVGRDLLRRIASALPLVREQAPDARLVMITGPRIDPREVPDVDRLEKRPYVHNLFEHLACCDAAIVQGGLSTSMELVATGRPFVYVPLARHWEQQHHVAHRLRHYGATRQLQFKDATPERLAETLLDLLACPRAYRPVPRDGARRAAERIARLLVGPRRNGVD